MKKKLLFSTALVAVLSATNVYAEDLTLNNGDTHQIKQSETERESFDRLSMTGGTLIGTASKGKEAVLEVNNADISGGSVSLTGYLPENPGDIANYKISGITAENDINISGKDTHITLNNVGLIGTENGGLNVSDGNIEINNGSLGVMGGAQTNISGGQINAVSGNIGGDNITISGGNINLKEESVIGGMDSLTISGGTINGEQNTQIMSDKLNVEGGKINLTDSAKLASYSTNEVSDFNITNKSEIIASNNSSIESYGLVEKDSPVQAQNLDANVSGGTTTLRDNAKFLIGAYTMEGANAATMELITENIDKNITGILNMTGGKLNMNDSSSIEIYTSNGKVNMDGSSISGSSAEELLSKAPTININGNNKIASDVNVEDGLIKISKGATLSSGDITLASGNFASIIDVSGTLNANVKGSDKAQMTFFDSSAKVKGTVDNIEDINVRSNLSLASAFEKGASNINNINVYGSTLTLDNENFNKAQNLILNNKSTAKLAKDFTASNKVKVKDGSVLDLGTSTLNAQNVELFEDAQVNLTVASLDNHGAIAASDKITFVGGNAEDGYSNGANKNINLNVTMQNGLVKKDETTDLTLLTATNGFDGDFNNINVANNRYKFEQIEAGKFKVTGIATGEDIAKDAGGTVNNAGTAAAWVDGDSFKAGTQSAVVAEKLNELSQKAGSEQAYVNALTAVAPEVAPMVQHTQTETANQVFGAIGTRLSGGSISTGGEGMSSGDNVFERAAMWVQGLFNKSKLDDTSKSYGFDADSNGIAMGAEKYVTEDTKVGLGYAYTNTDIDGFMRSTDVDTHTAFVYGEYKPSNWYVNSIVSYGWSDYDESKNVAGINVKSDYDVETFGLQTMTGYDMQFKHFGLTPEVGLRYVHISQDGYTDSADQKVSGNDSDILTGVIGAKVSKTWTLENGMNIKPEARIAATYDLTNDDTNSVVTLANGSAYMVEGDALDRFGMEFGAGVTAEVNNNVDFSLGYEGKFREDYQDHTGLVNLKYKF